MTSNPILPSLILAALLSSPAAVAGSAPYAVAGLPPAALRLPAADTCAALRSGTYRMISPLLGGTLADQSGKAILDAARLAFTRPDGSLGTWEAKGNCRFRDPGVDGFSVDYVVSQAGILVGRVTVNGGSSYRGVIGFPEQAHALAELAGTWSVFGLRAAPDSFHPDGGRLSWDRAGALTASTHCSNPESWAIDICAEAPGAEIAAVKPYVESADGGFVSRSGTRTWRLFLYQAAAGHPMLAGVDSDGEFFLGTVPEAMAMPPVGLTSQAWNLDLTGQLAAATKIYAITNVTASNDPPHRSWVRRKQNIGLPDEHLETLLADRPRIGMFTRPAGDAPTTTAGSATRLLHFNELTALNLPGTGVFPLVLPATKLFELSVVQP